MAAREGPDGRRAGRGVRAPGLRGHRRGARPRHRAPGPQAGEPLLRAARGRAPLGEGARLRNLEDGRAGLGQGDEHGGHLRLAALHVPRADAVVEGRRRTHGHLVPRRDPVRAGQRPRALRGRRDAGDRARDRDRRHAEAARAPLRPARGLRARRGALPPEGARAALRRRRGAGPGAGAVRSAPRAKRSRADPAYAPRRRRRGRTSGSLFARGPGRRSHAGRHRGEARPGGRRSSRHLDAAPRSRSPAPSLRWSRSGAASCCSHGVTHPQRTSAPPQRCQRLRRRRHPRSRRRPWSRRPRRPRSPSPPLPPRLPPPPPRRPNRLPRPRLLTRILPRRTRAPSRSPTATRRTPSTRRGRRFSRRSAYEAGPLPPRGGRCNLCVRGAGARRDQGRVRRRGHAGAGATARRQARRGSRQAPRLRRRELPRHRARRLHRAHGRAARARSRPSSSTSRTGQAPTSPP